MRVSAARTDTSLQLDLRGAAHLLNQIPTFPLAPVQGVGWVVDHVVEAAEREHGRTTTTNRWNLKAPLPEGLRWEIRKAAVMGCPDCHDRPVRRARVGLGVAGVAG
jgi:hypothetical protein